ncbi:arginine--tRNA ligase [Sedimentisphaera salicampi]|uniref:arginine--tRNA ligase n=1 Tax=Sedimentisphaera salicampi TaxID=1941349 RepID=UPI000B9B8784|nr:arginine--tRNA ligase [Sedimentisphaera salicampi]OXU14436.1 Arginine--tRNA ligase [Sedimentisphaera salicampi]
MKLTADILEERLSSVLKEITGSEFPAIVRPSANPKFGDYQSNGVMAAAKKTKQNPRGLAEKVADKLDVSDICDEPEIAGPGFINFRIKPEFLSKALLETASDPERLGIEKVQSPEKVVVDYSGPNIAKEMHVGHLRSTIIGDCICRLLEFAGHNAVRQNHIGDWGTQFGMLCALLERKKESGEKVSMALSDLESFYREAKKLYDEDEKFAQTARAAIAGLHRGEQFWKQSWIDIIEESRKHYSLIYQRLNATLTREDERGESAYAGQLQEIVDHLKEKGCAEVSDGAVCVFPEGFKNKDGSPLPFIVQKSDGAFLYATTDLAALKYRIDKLGADEIVYVTDARQILHFKMLFATAKLAGIAQNQKLRHVTFGTMLGEDGKPFKTRSGDTVKLKDLLEEAVERAYSVVNQKNPGLSEDEKKSIAEAVGIGAIKYSDYSNNRTTDYIFSFDKMLSMDGNTAPYMQYACARVKSIEKKAKEKGIDAQSEIDGLERLEVLEDAERDLAVHLLKYGLAIRGALAEYKPNFITAYLYELAQKFSAFYTNCPVLSSGGITRSSRLTLCRLTHQTLRHGLEEILRIDVPEQM